MSIDALDGPVRVAVESTPIDVGEIVEWVRDPGAGGVVVFLGTVRDHSPGKEGVTKLEYEAYAGVVEQKIRGIVDEVFGKWPLHRVAAVHRVGELEVGEISVIVAASAAHRKEAFPAARYLIDELKARAPIWKKEHWSGGAEWVREDQVHG